MNLQSARTLTLFDLLARRWQAPAAISDVRFTADGGAAAFASADGAILLAAAPDAEPPETRIRITGDLGQTTIRPRAKDPAPLVIIAGLTERTPPLAAAGSGFLVGDGEGRVLRVGLDGGVTPILALDGPVTALDHAAGVTAAAGGASLIRADAGDTRRWPAAEVAAVALSPDGARLAIADAREIRVIGGHDQEVAPVPGASRLAWRVDGAWLAAALGAEGVALLAPGTPEPARLRGFPAPVRSLAWSGPAGAFLAAGAYRVAAWDAGALPATDRALVTGQPGLCAVEAVAAHPTRPLIAAGYANGQVVIAQIGGRDELLLRQGGGAVTCLGFSADGHHLAIGDADGAAAIATFPPGMFK